MIRIETDSQHQQQNQSMASSMHKQRARAASQLSRITPAKGVLKEHSQFEMFEDPRSESNIESKRQIRVNSALDHKQPHNRTGANFNQDIANNLHSPHHHGLPYNFSKFT
jgi:hypothetical protein